MSAQQANQFTQFGYTKSYYNPALASAEDNLSITLRHRNQWSGIEGAPTGQAILVSLPNLHESISLGLYMNRNTVGISERQEASLAYGYRLSTDQLKVSAGLQATFLQFSNDFTDDRLIPIDGFENDGAIEQGFFQKSLFNIGAGLYVQGNGFYGGVSVPKLVKSDLDFDLFSTQALEDRILYGMFGLDLDLSPLWSFTPQALLKLSEAAPWDLDIQGVFIYQNQAHLGLNFRSGGTQESFLESVGCILGFRFSERILAIMSYDFNTTLLRQFENGSFEISLRYDMKNTKLPKEIHNPRYY